MTAVPRSSLAVFCAWVVVVLAASLTAGTASAQPDCNRLYNRADSLYLSNWVAWEKLVEGLDEARSLAFIELVRVAPEARSCFGDQQPEKLRKLYVEEAYARAALGQYDEAFRVFADFFAGLGNRTDGAWVPHAYWARAYLNLSLGRYSEAAGDYGKALLTGASRPPLWRAEVHLNLGHALQCAKSFDAAVQQYREAHSIAEKVEPSDGRTEILARALHYQADAAVERLGIGADALAPGTRDLVLRSLTLYRELPPSQYSTGAMVLLGDISLEEHRPTEALAEFQRASEQAGRLQDRGMNMLSEIGLGRAYRFLGRYDEAVQHLKTALALSDGTREGQEYERRALAELGLTYEVAGSIEEAESWYRETVAKVEEERQELGPSLWSLSSFSFWQQRAYRGLVRVLLQQGRSGEAFVQLETARARYLADALTARRSVAELSPHARTRYVSLTQELAIVRTSLAKTSGKEEPMLTAREAALQSAMARMVAFTPEPPRITLAGVQKMLGDSRILLSYFIDARDRERHRNPRSHVFVLTSDTLIAVPLAGVDDVSLDSLLDASGYGAGGSDGFIEEASRPLDGLHQMYAKLVAPAAALLRPGSSLIVVPDGPLSTVPFAALVEKPTHSFSYATAPYLVRRFPISYSFGAQFISAPETDPEPCRHVLAIGRSAFEENNEPSLPFVRAEITRLAHRFRDVRTLLDGKATEGALYASLGQADIVHIASHVVTDPLRPLRSRILLTPGGGEDGMVYMHEMLGEGMKSALVVLSACNTARGTAESGEGVLGLHYAFQAAGARSTVATLWEAADRPSAKIMSAFYTALGDGIPKDKALQKAQLAYLQTASGSAANPFFWAAPVLYGSTQPVALQGKYPLFAGRGWMVLASMLLGALLLRASHRKREKVCT